MAEVALRVQLGPFFANGQLQGGAKLYHFEAGLGEVNRDLYDDRNKVIPLPQPITADQNGIFNFFADGLYKLIICKPASTGPDDLALYTLDNWSYRDPADTTFTVGESLPSASTVGLGLDSVFHILGNTQIEAFSGALPFFWAIFDGTPNLVHSANLLLPGNRNRKMQSGDTGFFINEGAGVFRLSGHLEAEGNFVGRQGSTITAATTIAPPTDGDFVDISGGEIDITAIGNAPAGFRFTARCTGDGVQFIHSAQLICPWLRDYRAFETEILEFRSLGSSTWILCSLNGPHLTPSTMVPLHDTAADDGFVLPIGTALIASRYRALAKRLIPSASVLGVVGTSLGNPTFASGTDTWTLSSHGLVDGDLVHLTNSGGALPTGFAADTMYHVVNSDNANTFKLSLSRGGTPVDGTTNGTGTHTVHHKFQIHDVRGVVLAALDNLGGAAKNRVTSASTNGANASVLGGVFGTQTHPLTGAEVGPHTHTYQTAQTGSAGTGRALGSDNATNGGTGTTDSSGSGTGHSNTQPSMACGVQMRA
jgi:hypothetical protein